MPYYIHNASGEPVDFEPTGGQPGEWRKVTRKEHDAAVRDRARDYLRGLLPPGATAYTVLRRASKSGMLRHISVVVGNGGDVQDVTWAVARAIGETMDSDTGGVRVTGCGMDMGFSLVYSLGRALYPDGFAPTTVGIRPADGKRVNVNVGRGRNAKPMTREDFAALVAKGWKFPGGRNGDASGWDTDGGYALTHRWL